MRIKIGKSDYCMQLIMDLNTNKLQERCKNDKSDKGFYRFIMNRDKCFLEFLVLDMVNNPYFMDLEFIKFVLSLIYKEDYKQFYFALIEKYRINYVIKHREIICKKYADCDMQNSALIEYRNRLMTNVASDDAHWEDIENQLKKRHYNSRAHIISIPMGGLNKKR